MSDFNFKDVRSSVSVLLQSNDYSVDFNVKPKGFTSSVDIVAEKGSLFKKILWISIASNPFEASISAYLLKDIRKGRKIIFLNEGNPNEVNVTGDVEVINELDALLD